jgi:hypothetical protein
MTDLYEMVRFHMDRRGMSLRALAKALHHDPSYLSKALRGVKPCGPRLAAEIDGLLCAGGEIIEVAARREALARQDHVPVRQAATVPQRDLAEGHARRDLAMLAMTVTSLLDVLRDASPDLPERIARGPRVDAETAAGLENVMLGYRQIYQSAGAPALLDPVYGALRLLTQLAPSAGAYLGQVVSLIGQASSLAATMLMLDRGDYAGASKYLAVAARAAQQCGDAEVMSIALAARAFHCAYTGDLAGGRAFASEAVHLAGPAVHPRTRGWVSAVESEMHATAGDEESFSRAVDTAAGHLQAPMPQRQWKGIGAFIPAKLTAYRGSGLMRLHRYAEAEAVLLDALGQLDPVQAKHRCTAHVDLAYAYARDRKPDEAAHHATAALDIIAVTGHAESMRRATRVYEAIRPSRTAAARDLGGQLMAVRAGLAG